MRVKLFRAVGYKRWLKTALATLPPWGACLWSGGTALTLLAASALPLPERSQRKDKDYDQPGHEIPTSIAHTETPFQPPSLNLLV
jgi:hypothetical protein